MNRRDFLRCGIGGTLLAGAGLRGARSAAGGVMRTSLSAGSAQLDFLARPDAGDLLGRVVLAHEMIPPGMQVKSNRDALPATLMRERLAAGMVTLLGADPWRRLFKSNDVVAIKINGLASGTLSPRPELVAAITDGIRTAGVSPGNIIIWDRTTREVERSGFPTQLEASAVRAYGTDALRGGGYSQDIFYSGAVGSMVSRIVSQYATALVNVSVLKDHDLAGLSGGMKNLYGVIHNPNRYHANSCDPFVAEVMALEPVRKRLRLTILDAAVAQAEGGPAYAPDWIWPCDCLILGVDPVACDATAGNLLEAERVRRGLPSLAEAGRPYDWLATAAYIGLGRDTDLRVIDV